LGRQLHDEAMTDRKDQANNHDKTSNAEEEPPEEDEAR
jgi:hypothetical protein